MSGKVVGWAMEQRTGSPVAKLVLVKLADNANEQGICWPSVPLIMQHTELSERAVRKHLRALELAGLISVEKQSQNGHQTANVYRLAVPNSDVSGPAPRAPTPLHNVHPPRHKVQADPAPSAPTPLHEVQGNKNRHLEPSKNPRARERLPDGPLANALKEAIGPGIFRTYFAGATISVPEGKPPKLLLANEFNRSRVATRFERQVRNVMGDHVEIGVAGSANAEAEQTPYWVDR
jgi:DNA-binding transcriptional ArsR family regulator